MLETRPGNAGAPAKITLLEIAQRRPASEKRLGEIKGVTELIIRRFGREILGAVKLGMKRKHGPIPKREGKLNGSGNSRRRMDRGTEKRLGLLKRWRTRRAKELCLDPGVMCPNSALEAIAWLNPGEIAADAAPSKRKPRTAGRHCSRTK